MRFSIRDLFLVTVIVALAMGWWVDRGRLAANMAEMQLKLKHWPAYPGEIVELEMDRSGSVSIFMQGPEEVSYTRLPPMTASRAPAPIPPKP